MLHYVQKSMNINHRWLVWPDSFHWRCG